LGTGAFLCPEQRLARNRRPSPEVGAGALAAGSAGGFDGTVAARVYACAPHSSGWHGSAEVVQGPFAQWGASAVLAGHDHPYERLLIDGIPYFVNGLGGHPARYPFTATVKGSQLYFNEDYGAMRVEATDSEITFQFITRAGELIDAATFTRPDRGQ
jgi:hypothetical protein